MQREASLITRVAKGHVARNIARAGTSPRVCTCESRVCPSIYQVRYILSRKSLKRDPQIAWFRRAWCCTSRWVCLENNELINELIESSGFTRANWPQVDSLKWFTQVIHSSDSLKRIIEWIHEWIHSSVKPVHQTSQSTQCIRSSDRPTQSIIYVPLQVKRFQNSILPIVEYKYFKSCSENIILQNLILRTRSCGIGFITQCSWVFHFHKINMIDWKCFVPQLYQFRRGISGGQPLKETHKLLDPDEISIAKSLSFYRENPQSETSNSFGALSFLWVENELLVQMGSSNQISCFLRQTHVP